MGDVGKAAGHFPKFDGPTAIAHMKPDALSSRGPSLIQTRRGQSKETEGMQAG